MKKMILLLLVLFISCGVLDNEDEQTNSHELVGSWKLISTTHLEVDSSNGELVLVTEVLEDINHLTYHESKMVKYHTSPEPELSVWWHATDDTITIYRAKDIDGTRQLVIAGPLQWNKHYYTIVGDTLTKIFSYEDVNADSTVRYSLPYKYARVD